MYKLLACFRDTSHQHHHHGVVTPWKDLYFPKGCGGPGPATGAASGPGGVVGGHPGTPGTPRALLKCQSSWFYSYSNIHISSSYLSSVFLFHERKSVVSSLFSLKPQVLAWHSQSLANNSGSAGSIPSRSIWGLYWTKWQWVRFPSQNFGFLLLVSFHQCSILMLH